MKTVREQYNPLQYGKTAMGMDTLEKNGSKPHAIKAWPKLNFYIDALLGELTKQIPQ